MVQSTNPESEGGGGGNSKPPSNVDVKNKENIVLFVKVAVAIIVVTLFLAYGT